MAMARIELPPQPRILVITMRRLGDVLLTTPLVRTLRQGIPGARIDMLVFRGTEGMLAGNPDIDRVIVMSQRPRPAEVAKAIVSLWRRYDVAISTQGGDRPTALAIAAGRLSIGIVPSSGGRWKRLMLSRSVPSNSEVHRVFELHQLAQVLGIERRADVVVPAEAAPLPPRRPYAVLHAHPMFKIRRWTDAGWRGLAAALSARGLDVVVTGGPGDEERAYLDNLWNSVQPPVERADGKLGWGRLAQLLSGAAVFVGPDTSVTHLAAASGCPTVGIYGPASPHGMGPWPVGGLDEPWAKAGSIQRRGNVWVVQNPLPCMPCDLLGCERHLNSHSACLDELPLRQVLQAVDQALGVTP